MGISLSHFFAAKLCSYEETPIGKSAINKILSVLGVWTDRKKDEFDMLGLGNFRDTESAVSSAS